MIGDHRCKTCGVAVPAIIGKGRPLAYCDLHAPPRRAYLRTWQRTNAAAVRDYQRDHCGYRPTVAATCAGCGEPFRTYTGATLCTHCRPRARYRLHR